MVADKNPTESPDELFHIITRYAEHELGTTSQAGPILEIMRGIRDDNTPEGQAERAIFSAIIALSMKFAQHTITTTALDAHKRARVLMRQKLGTKEVPEDAINIAVGVLDGAAVPLKLAEDSLVVNSDAHLRK